MLGDAGYSAVASGWLLTLYQVVAMVVGLVVPALARRYDQRVLAFGAGFLSACGSLGVLLAPARRRCGCWCWASARGRD